MNESQRTFPGDTTLPRQWGDKSEGDISTSVGRVIHQWGGGNIHGDAGQSDVGVTHQWWVISQKSRGGHIGLVASWLAINHISVGGGSSKGLVQPEIQSAETQFRAFFLAVMYS